MPNMFPKNPNFYEYKEKNWLVIEVVHFYQVLFRHPILLFVGQWRRVYEFLFYNKSHSAYWWELFWNLWLALTLPLLPITVAPYLLLMGPAIREHLGGVCASHIINLRTELTWAIDGALRYYKGCHIESPTFTASKTFWMDHFNMNGIRTTEMICRTSELTDSLPKQNLIAKEDCSLYGLGTTVVTYQKDGSYGVGMSGEQKMMSEKEAIALLKSHPKDRLLQKFVKPCEHLGIHAVRLTTFRLGGKAEFIYGYMSVSEGYTTATCDGGSHVADYDIDFENNVVGPHVLNGTRRSDYEGKSMPGLQKAIELAIKAHEALQAGIHTQIGWDICLTDDGPVFFEGNPACGGYQMMLILRDWFQLDVDIACLKYCTDDKATLDWDGCLTPKERKARLEYFKRMKA